jgi:hypothetical protein
MTVGLLTLELFLPASVSLKDKRKVLSSLQARLRGRHNLAIAEVGNQDLWQRASLAVVSVGAHRDPIERMFDDVLAEAERTVPGQVLSADREFFG